MKRFIIKNTLFLKSAGKTILSVDSFTILNGRTICAINRLITVSGQLHEKNLELLLTTHFDIVALGFVLKRKRS